MPLDNATIQQKLTAKFADAISEWETPYNLLSCKVAVSTITDVLAYLYNDSELSFQFLTDLTGVHFPERAGEELCVVYHLHNMRANSRLRLKVYVPIDNPCVPTASSLFSAANWMERETYDFFGIIFEGHPNLTRILNVNEMDYFPMRKEYEMEDPTRTDKDDEMFGRGSLV
ncbi:MAG: NADH-quinone oxidoreductase subunit C [Chitinophagia bacterium]|nr:NADH-quinone oxidoreductase subunit C [Chitinophagia bacterium]